MPADLLSLGEEMVKPHTRKRADSGNVNRHTHRAMIAVGVTCKQPASTAPMKKGGGRRHGRCSICRTEKQTGNVASAQNGFARSAVSGQFK